MNPEQAEEEDDDDAHATTPMLQANASNDSNDASRRAECGSRLQTTMTQRIGHSTSPRLSAGNLNAGTGQHTQQLHGTPSNGSSGRRRFKLFERANDRWWNPQFASVQLESCYWKASFPQMRDRFRCGIVYLIITDLLWIVYHLVATPFSVSLPYHLGGILVIFVAASILGFTFTQRSYQRFYLPTSFLSMFLICVVSLLVFSLQQHPLISPIGCFACSVQAVLLLYTVIPLPLYMCVLTGAVYSVLYEVLATNTNSNDHHGVKLVLHLAVHLLGVHIYILTQVRQRKTFIKVGESLLARKELLRETELKEDMILSVMPKFIADQLLTMDKEKKEDKPGISQSPTTARANDMATFRPFTMNTMPDVSILFADIAGFTKMSSNKTADELVTLLNDLFGRFDRVCGLLGCEKISTLGDCYYAVSGCPKPRPDHAKCCVELGLHMITAIKQFDEDNGQEVNMRVGIHTGTVMCGLVGSKRYKFDVFSNDVILANEMESSGMAGRVHISEMTAKNLGDDYILEAGEKHYFSNTAVKGRLQETMKSYDTYFVVGRKECSTSPDRDDLALPSSDEHSRMKKGTQRSFKKESVVSVQVKKSQHLSVDV